MKTTDYFETIAQVNHSEVRREWCEDVLRNPIKAEVQLNGRISFWANIPEANGRALRIITLEDGETVHNAFFDRNFYRRQQRGEEL